MQFNNIIDVVFLAVIAAVLLIKLISIMGERRDDDPKMDDTPNRRDMTSLLYGKKPKISTPNPATTETADVKPKPMDDLNDIRFKHAKEGLRQIMDYDTNFYPSEFLVKAEELFENILTAYVKGDKAAETTLNQLVAADLAQHLIKTLITRRDKNLMQEEKNLIGIDQMTIQSAEVENTAGGQFFRIAVLFESEQIYALYDKAKPIDDEARLVEGDPERILKKKDLWVFGGQLQKHNKVIDWRLLEIAEV